MTDKFRRELEPGGRIGVSAWQVSQDLLKRAVGIYLASAGR